MIYKVPLFLILLKPVIDLTWRCELFYIGNVLIRPQRIFALLIPILIIFISFFNLCVGGKVKVIRSLPIYFFLCIVMLTMVIHGDINTFNEGSRFFSVFIVFIFGCNIMTMENHFKIFKAIVLVTFVPTFVSYLQLLNVVPCFQRDFIYGLGYISRIAGGYQQPLGYLYYIVIAFPLLLYLYENLVVRKLFFWTWICVTLPMVVLSYHRTTIIMLFMQVVIYMVFSNKMNFKIFLIFLFAAIIIFSGQKLFYILTSGSNEISAYMLRGRAEIWRSYLMVFREFSLCKMLFGNGNSFNSVLNFSEPHSDIIRILYVYGVLGFLSILSFWIITSQMLLVKMRQEKIKIKSIYFPCLLIVASWTLLSITTEPLRYTNFGWSFALVTSLIYSNKQKVLV